MELKLLGQKMRASLVLHTSKHGGDRGNLKSFQLHHVDEEAQINQQNKPSSDYAQGHGTLPGLLHSKPRFLLLVGRTTVVIILMEWIV